MTAADKGKVVFAGFNTGGYGNAIEIAHQNDKGETVSYTFYGHLSKIDVHVGDEVDAGQEVGETGKTGNAAGVGIPAHLHFEIRTQENSGKGLNGRIDPQPELGTHP